MSVYMDYRGSCIKDIESYTIYFYDMVVTDYFIKKTKMIINVSSVIENSNSCINWKYNNLKFIVSLKGI